jgi:hypothetical protein
VANPDGINDDVRKREEEYFRQRDKELIERMRKAAESEQARKDLQNASGIQDPALLQDLEELGFKPDALALLPLIPVLQVAWAEGGVSAAERTMITNLARSRGIADGTPADQQLTEWLDRRPSDETFSKAGRLIAAMLDRPGPATVNADDLLAYCEQIAAASGGLFGIGRVSAEERAALEQIAKQLRRR